MWPHVQARSDPGVSACGSKRLLRSFLRRSLEADAPSVRALRASRRRMHNGRRRALPPDGPPRGLVPSQCGRAGHRLQPCAWPPFAADRARGIRTRGRDTESTRPSCRDARSSLRPWSWFSAIRSTSPRKDCIPVSETGCFAWRRFRILNSTKPRRCGCPRTTSRALSRALRTTHITSACREGAWTTFAGL